MDRDAYETEVSLRKQEVRAHRSERATLTPVALAAVPAGRLTQSEEWNFFLRMLQNRLELAEQNLLEIEKADRENTDFDPVRMSTLKSARREWAQRIDTLNEVMELPKEILADAQKAKKLLEEKDRAEEA